MNEQRDGISSPQVPSSQQRRTKIAAPAGHTPVCWAGALGQARRGRPPEDFAVSAERAHEMLLTDPASCRCIPTNKGVRGRRQR